MSATFSCPQCGRLLQTEHAEGETIRCACGEDLIVPAQGAAETGEFHCRTCGARGSSRTCEVCGGQARPARLTATDSASATGPSSPGTSAPASRGAGPPTPARATPAGTSGAPIPPDVGRRRLAQARRMDSFQVGPVLSRSFSLYGRHLVPITGLGLGVYLPIFVFVVLVSLTSQPGYDPFPEEAFTPESVILTLLTMIVGQALTAALIDAVLQWLRGRSPSLGRSLRHGFRCLFRVLGVSFVAGLGAAVLVGVPMALLMLVGLQLLAIPLALVAMVFLVPRLWLATVVTVVEGLGVVASIRRSFALTKGLAGRILLILIVVGLLNGLVTFGGGMVSALLPDLVGVVVLQALAVVTMCFSAVLQTVGYHDVRQATEGIDTDELAAIFE